MSETHAIHSAVIARGNIYFSAETIETYFNGVTAVALVPDPNGILVFPLIHDSAGGLLLKTRNLRGDKIVQAQEFFRNNRYRETNEGAVCPVRWVTEKAALEINGVARCANDQVQT
ncbi:MAG: hypothetical protein HOP17_03290 [Acidobacteria bacterium]|nr:hypothetical protein [Acidobacteriota bacterium]